MGIGKKGLKILSAIMKQKTTKVRKCLGFCVGYGITLIFFFSYKKSTLSRLTKAFA